MIYEIQIEVGGGTVAYNYAVIYWVFWCEYLKMNFKKLLHIGSEDWGGWLWGVGSGEWVEHSSGFNRDQSRRDWLV